MKPKQQINIRLYAVLTVLSLLPMLVAAQVGWIYVSEGKALRLRGRDQARTRIEIPAMRGTIYDRTGRALAMNVARYDLALDPTLDGFWEKAASFFEKLSDLTGVPASTYRRMVEERYSPQYVLLRRALTEAQKKKVASWNVPGVIFSARFDRRYNYDRAASHVLGTVSAGGKGLAGLELQYDEYLVGEPGWRVAERDRSGRLHPVVGGRVARPEHGQNLVLTIGLVRQKIMEEALQHGIERSGAQWGTAIAVNPNTGAILAMATVPDYNPNNPGEFPASVRRNRAITDQYEPGSAFKLVTAAAAIQEGVVAPGDSIETGVGYEVFNGDPMWDTHAIGTATFAKVIAQSSNVGTAKVASRLDKQTFYGYAHRLGFGQPTGIDLPGEADGLLKKPSTWSGTTKTSMAIGYAVAVTPLQLVMAYAALANGGMVMEPYVVAERRSMSGELLWRHTPRALGRAFSRETARKLVPIFERVVEKGTATQAQIRGLRVAGKTGTARKAKTHAPGYWDDKYRATFVGFYPAGDPRVAMVVMLDEPQTSIYGGAVAAPIFRRIARRWMHTFPEVQQQMNIPDPTARLASASTNPPVRTVEATAPVPARTPMRLAATRPASTHRTPAETRPGRLPDLEGLSARRAVYRLRRLGVEVRVKGRGQVVRQQPRHGSGAELPERVTLYCQASNP